MKKAKCYICGADLKEPHDGKLHFCGKDKNDPCIMEYWRRLHEQYGKK